MMKKLFLLLTLVTFWLPLAAKTVRKPAQPFLFQDFRETEKKFIYSPQWYPDLCPVTMNDFRAILQSDTCEYKIVIVYDQQPLEKMLIRNLYVDYIQKQQLNHSVSTYYVATDCGGLVTCQKYLKRCKVPTTTMYYFRDSLPDFIGLGKFANPERLNNRVKFLFENAQSCNAAWQEQTWIVDRRNYVKMAEYQFDTADSISNGIAPIRLRDILKYSLDELNFDVIDTLRYQ